MISVSPEVYEPQRPLLRQPVSEEASLLGRKIPAEGLGQSQIPARKLGA